MDARFRGHDGASVDKRRSRESGAHSLLASQGSHASRGQRGRLRGQLQDQQPVQPGIVLEQVKAGLGQVLDGQRPDGRPLLGADL